MKIGVADYGLNVWDGNCFDIEERLLKLKSIGYEGTERLAAVSEADAVYKAALYHRLGMDFATVRGPDPQTVIQWTAAFGKTYVWTQVTGKDFDTFCRQVNHQIEICRKWNIKVALHNHLGSLCESQEEVEEFLKRCPECGLVFDTAHLAAADGNCFEIVERYGDRIVAVHLKDWLVTNPEIGLERWPQRGRFCELDGGNIGLDNAAVLKAIADAGYDDWVFVEHDTHIREPMEDLAHSRDVIRKAGF